MDVDIDSYDTKSKLNGLKSRLGLKGKASLQELDLSYRFKTQEAISDYKEIWRGNLMRIGNGLVREMEWKWIKNPSLKIRNEIRRLQSLAKDKDVMIITAFSQENSLNITKWWLKSPYQLNDSPFWERKKYWNLRESTDKWLNIYGLDPKYATMVVEKKDFKFLKESYWYDSYIQHSFNELSWRSGATYYDSILTARLSWKIDENHKW